MSGSGEILLQGSIIYGDDFEVLNGYICIKDGVIREFGRDRVEADLEGIVAPCFVNAHVHLGDSAFKDPPYLPLPDLVGPGGLKSRMLESTGRARIVEGIRRSLLQMHGSGTSAFVDFREGGADGVSMLEEALLGLSIVPRIFGRPGSGEEAAPLSCWGVGISSTRDHPMKMLKGAVDVARARGQAVGIHAGEAGRDDIAGALELEPDFLVHMCSAREEDLRAVSSRGLPVVVCPRSNLMTGSRLPDVREMLRQGITVAVGTDNVMLNSPDMFMEMHLMSLALLHDDRQVFKMCTLNGAAIAGLDHRLGSILEGKDARVMLLDPNSNNLWGSSSPLSSIVRRAGPSDILALL